MWSNAAQAEEATYRSGVSAYVALAATVLHDDDTEFTGAKDRVYDSDTGATTKRVRLVL